MARAHAKAQSKKAKVSPKISPPNLPPKVPPKMQKASGNVNTRARPGVARGPAVAAAIRRRRLPPPANKAAPPRNAKRARLHQHERIKRELELQRAGAAASSTGTAPPVKEPRGTAPPVKEPRGTAPPVKELLRRATEHAEFEREARAAHMLSGSGAIAVRVDLIFVKHYTGLWVELVYFLTQGRGGGGGYT